jgi:hypothetical protein
MEEKVKLVLPFPHFLWMIGTNPASPKRKLCCMNRKRNKKISLKLIPERFQETA